MAMLPPDPIYIFKGEMLSVSCVAFEMTNLNRRIYAGTQSGNVHVWNLESKREVGNFKAGDSTCLSVCIPREEEIVVAHIKSGEITFWKEDSARWTQLKEIKIDFFGFCKCQIFDNVLYAPLKSAKCELISVKTTETLERINLEIENSGDVMAFKVCRVNDRKIAVVAYEGLKLGVWDLEESKVSGVFQLDECPMAVDYNASTGKGICGGPGDKILVFSLDKNLEIKMLRRVPMTNAGVAAVGIRPDGKLAAVGCWDGKVRLYSCKSYVLLAALDVHSGTVQDVSFGEEHKEGSKVQYLLAAGSQDSRISLWDLYN